MRKETLVKVLIAGATALPLVCTAESNLQTTSGQTALAHVDFQISVPKFLFLQVGSGSSYATGVYTANATVDQITWNLTTANVGTGPIAGTGGVPGPSGTELAALVCNSGNAVTFTSTTAGALNDGAAGDTISYANITVASAAGSFATPLTHPTLVDGGAGTTVTINGAGHVVKADAKWTYSYTNNTVPAGGVYGGGGVANTGNGRVTYTATMP